ncbi:helix-turn-helix domain-containing protein [Methylobacterium sp. E-041]|uniref:AraC family transcriptional regulator n=1 Tax=Methylobacterium sp. E-041 TaxID=2836573 RepID=UPI001FBBB97E|nr:helix-turn-helix domain-containing protein [Methylobacterium sp. E-041]MCJ2108793.1 helix-turn-helix domain-containing protein [Methylobacterium sp. E-041]
MKGKANSRSGIWRPRGRIAESIGSATNVRDFNDRDMVPVQFEIGRSSEIKIELVGSQSDLLSFWDVRSVGPYSRRPKSAYDIVTINFTLGGHTNYVFQDGRAMGAPTTAILADHQDLSDAQSSGGFHLFGCSISKQALTTINAALTGGEATGFPPFARGADMGAPGIRALYCAMRQIYRRCLEVEPSGDHTLALMQEILGYQLLSAWPRRAEAIADVRRQARPSRLSLAKDYIQTYLATPLALSDIAAAAGLSVRGLQDNFRRSVDQTPFQYIIQQRLMRVHEDLVATSNMNLSVGDIARRWGFVHMSDFGQRYRRMYGCAPTQTRREASGRP